MDSEQASLLLQRVIDHERRAGCPMALDCLVEPALRRWRSYDRRFKQHKVQSLAHRTQDLLKGLLEWYPDHGYDENCLEHLARSFAAVLWDGSETTSTH